MNLQLDRLNRIPQNGLSVSERAVAACQRAKQLEKAGEYRAACDALEEFWPDTTGTPRVEDLSEYESALVLLRAGALAGWLGSVEQTGTSQEHAKNLITSAIERFEKIGRPEVAEAHSDLALCYWREGAFDEARVILRRVIDELPADNTIKAVALVRAAVVEKTATKYAEANALLKQAEPLVEASDDHSLKGSFHISLGTLLNCRAVAERRQDFIDQSLIAFTAASYHFEQAGHDRFRARVEANLGYLFFTIGRHRDAHTHLDRARYLFLGLHDVRTAAQVDDTRAQVLLAEGQVIAAERVARGAVKVLERGDEQAILAGALVTHGVALARIGHQSRARTVLDRAVSIARIAGDGEGAGRACLATIEELGSQTSAKELISTYRSALEFLKGSEDSLLLRRLVSSLESVLEVIDDSDGPPEVQLDKGWQDFSLKREVRKFEEHVIERALRDAGGSVTKAALLLGFNHHQSLISLLNGRHKSLEKSRSTARKRRRNIAARRPKGGNKAGSEVVPGKSEISILHVEDNEKIARSVADLLTEGGMHVDSCADGSTAARILKGSTLYDAIILDNGLPGLSGVELVKRVRSLPHRRAIPIVMFSTEDVEREAWRAGVDEFLLKSAALDEVSFAINRLVKGKSES
jgi:CheY-like chemotaxis protein